MCPLDCQCKVKKVPGTVNGMVTCVLWIVSLSKESTWDWQWDGYVCPLDCQFKVKKVPGTGNGMVTCVLWIVSLR